MPLGEVGEHGRATAAGVHSPRRRIGFQPLLLQKVAALDAARFDPCDRERSPCRHPEPTQSRRQAPPDTSGPPPGNSRNSKCRAKWESRRSRAQLCRSGMARRSAHWSFRIAFTPSAAVEHGGRQIGHAEAIDRLDPGRRDDVCVGADYFGPSGNTRNRDRAGSTVRSAPSSSCAAICRSASISVGPTVSGLTSSARI